MIQSSSDSGQRLFSEQRLGSGQCLIVKADKWLLPALTWIPILVAVIIWGVFNQGLARDMAIGIVDHDHTQFSRELVRHYDASQALMYKAITPIHYRLKRRFSLARSMPT